VGETLSTPRLLGLVQAERNRQAAPDPTQQGSTRCQVPRAGSPQLVQQRLRIFQIGRVETFGEPAVDWSEKVAGFGAPALITPKSGEAARGAQFPEPQPR
jgi:hypothetical protein